MMSNLYVPFEHTHTGCLKSFSLEGMSHKRNHKPKYKGTQRKYAKQTFSDNRSQSNLLYSSSLGQGCYLLKMKSNLQMSEMEMLVYS